MSRLTRALALLALAALLVGLLGAFVVAQSDHVDYKALTIVIAVGIAAAWIGTGLYAWWRRPRNRVGALMTWTGFAWLANVFVAANSPAIFTLAVMTSNLYLAAFVHLLLAYPDGRLRCRRHTAPGAGHLRAGAGGPDPDPDVRAGRGLRHVSGLRDPDHVGHHDRPDRRRPDDRRGAHAGRGDRAGADAPLAERRPRPSAARWRRCCGRAWR